MKYEDILNPLIKEGIHDQHILKAIIMIGGPGSGKSFIVSKIKAGTGLKVVDPDNVFEYLAKKYNHDIKNLAKTEQGNAIHHYAWTLTNKQMKTYLDGRLGLILDSTGKNYERLTKISKKLQDLGYDIKAIFVNTNIDTASKRNQERHRTVDDSYLQNTHDIVKDNLGKFQNYFKNNLLIIDNSEDSKIDVDMLWKDINKFISSPVQNPIGKQWLQSHNNKPVNEAEKPKKKDKYPLEPLLDDQYEIYLNYAKKLVNFLNKNCQPWMKATNNGAFTVWRGVKTKGSEDQIAYLRKTRTDRKPLNTHKNTHKEMNEYIARNGRVANRENALFVSGDLDIAEKYGRVFAVYPVGKFNYTWDSRYTDWTYEFYTDDQDDDDPLLHIGSYDLAEKLTKVPLTSEEVLAISNILLKQFGVKKFSDNELLLKSPSEINVKKVLKTVKHVKFDFGNKYNTIINILKSKMPKKPEIKKSKTLFGDDGTLQKAIKSENEIMVACESAVFIEEYFYRYFFKKILHGKIPSRNDYKEYKSDLSNSY